jgi:uncharacterized membrane protein
MRSIMPNMSNPPDAALGPTASAGPRSHTDTTMRLTRALALFSTLGLIALGLAWELWLAPTGSGTLALKVLPLVAAVAGLSRMRMFTYRWLSLLVWVYVTEGLMRAASDSGVSRWLAVAEVLLSLVLFGACAAHIRWRLRRARDAGIAHA